jgi:hypothetical protein
MLNYFPFVVATVACISTVQANIYVSFGSAEAFSMASLKTSGSLIKAFPENNTLEIYAVPLEFRGNSRSFSPVAAFLVTEEIALSNRTISPIVLTRSVYPNSNASSFEIWAVRTASQLSPVALIAHSGAFGTGGYQVNKIYEDEFTTLITVPVVHISTATATILLQILDANQGVLNVTITDWPANNYMERKSGGVFVFYSVFLCTWAAAIIILAIVAMVRRGVGRNLGTLCLILDIVGACVRLLWGLDPFAGRFLPPGVLETLFTGSLPIVLSGTIILLLFWHELATQISLQVSGVLEKKTKPAVFSICILFTAEIISASLRSSRVREISFPAAALPFGLPSHVVFLSAILQRRRPHRCGHHLSYHSPSDGNILYLCLRDRVEIPEGKSHESFRWCSPDGTFPNRINLSQPIIYTPYLPFM